MSAGSEGILGNRKRKDASKNWKRVTSGLSTAKKKGRVDTTQMTRRRKNIDTYISELHPILLETKIDIDEVGTCKQLHDHSRSNDWCDTELHG